MPTFRHPFITQVGRRIAEIRRARGLTQEGLAARLDVSTKYLQRVEHGKENLTLLTMVGLAETLEVPVAALLDPPASAAARTGRPRRESRPPALGAAASFRIVRERDAGAVPLLSLSAAGGPRGEAELAEVAAWLVPTTRRRVRKDMFVLQVHGTSMEPTVPDGSFCLFDPRHTEPDGGVFLVEHMEDAGPGGETACTLKRVERRIDARTRRHEIALRGDSPEFEPVVYDAAASVPPLRIVARLVEVLGT